MLETQHQLDQLRLRKPLEFLPIHRQDESHTGRLGKGVGSYGPIDDQKTYVYEFADWKTLENLIKESKSVAIAFPIANSQFKVYRFSLFGMTEAQKEAEEVWIYMAKQKKDGEVKKAVTSNSVI